MNMNLNRIKCIGVILMLALLTACGGGGGNPGTSSGGSSVSTPLFTSAPGAITLSSGTTSPVYSISGGVAPYTANSDKPSLLSVSLNESGLTITAVTGNSGSGTVLVTDSKGTKITVTVTVPAPTALFSTAPANLTLAIGASSSTYSVTGGTGPYTAVSTNPALVGATISAGTNLLTISALSGTAGGTANVIVADSRGNQLTVAVTVSAPTALFSTAPANLTLAIGASSSAYSITGGAGSYTAVSTNQALVGASISAGTNLLTISALTGTAGGKADVIVSDAKGNQLTVVVTVSAPTALFSTAPASLTLAIGASSSAYSITGGAGSYTAVSTNQALVGASISAGTNLLTISALSGTAGGTANVIVSDAKGNQLTVAVTVSAPIQVALFVDAPANLTVGIGVSSNSYTISGGTGPYTAVSSNTAVLTLTALSSTGKFAIQGVSAGNASVTVKDAMGIAITISVTVPAPAALFSTAPGTLQILSGTTNFYTLFGGTAPYVVNTNGVIAKAVLSGTSLAISGLVVGHQTVAVSDAKGSMISIDVTVNQGLYTDAPASLTVASRTGATYSIYGGVPYSGTDLYRVNSSNPAIASATVTGSLLSISGLSAGSTSLVISDSLGGTSLIAVTVPAAGALMSTAPSSLTLATGNSGVYTISGGGGTYTATSSNPGLVSASVSNGSTLTIGAAADTLGGTANVIVTDSAGTSPLVISVTAATVQFFTTAPSSLVIAAGYSKVFAVFGGAAPYSIVNTHPSVVAGSISGSTLSIVGSTAGSGTVIVTDAKGVSVPIAVVVSAPGPLSVSAPGNGVTISTSATYDIVGGVPPFASSSSDLSVAQATIENANQVRVNAMGAGRATVAVIDSVGTKVSVDVTVPGPSTLVMYTTAPAAGVFLANTDLPVSYDVYGGRPAYSVTSSNVNVVQASVSSSSRVTLQAIGAGKAEILVRDTSGLSVTIPVTVGSANGFFVAAPPVLNMSAGSTTLAPYRISGGAKPYSVSTSDFRVATAVVDPVTSLLTVSALSAGTATLKIDNALGTNSYAITVVVDNASGGGSSGAASIDILAASNTLNSTPGSSVGFVVTVKNGANVALPGQTVVFTASSGTLTGANPAPVTNAAGVVSTVSLSPGADASNRIISVTATVGGISNRIDVQVVGTTLTLNGPASVLLLSTQDYTVKAVDSSGKPVVGAVLTITSTNGNLVNTSPVLTDRSGVGEFKFVANNAGPATLTVDGLSATKKATVNVSAENFKFLTPTAGDSFKVGAPIPANPAVTVQYLTGNPPAPLPAGQVVNFATTRGALYSDAALTLPTATALTDGSGIATVYVKSDTAGPVTLSAQFGTASNSVPAAFVATVPAAIVLQANPAALLPNTVGSTTNQSALTAVVRDTNLNPVQGVAVNFNAVSDPSGGSISPGSVTTDAGGVATAQFVAGPSTTANNGVIISATVQSSPAITSTATLTVNGSALFISIARSSSLVSVDSTTYEKEFSVYVTDATGAPAGNRTVTLSARPTTYGKGVLVPPTLTNPNWDYASNAIIPGLSSACFNEDANKNGVLDAGEDFNNNGKLDPGNPAAITSSVTTDALGFGTFTLRYGKNYAFWVTSQITAKSLVSGTESSQVQDYMLEMLHSDAISPSTPANAISPFGYGADRLPLAISCSDKS